MFAQGLRGLAVNLGSFVFLPQPQIDFGQTQLHGYVAGIHFQSFLKNADGAFEFTRAQEFFRYL